MFIIVYCSCFQHVTRVKNAPNHRRKLYCKLALLLPALEFLDCYFIEVLFSYLPFKTALYNQR